jgi:hypothetical protein
VATGIGTGTHNPRMRTAAGLCLTPRGHWDRLPANTAKFKSTWNYIYDAG